MGAIWYAIVYGVLTIAGGTIGYVQAGSTTSLASGLVAGLLILVSTWAWYKGFLPGYYSLWALSLVLGGFFAMRFLKTSSFMPAGLMVLLSVAMLVGLWLSRSQQIVPGPGSS